MAVVRLPWTFMLLLASPSLARPTPPKHGGPSVLLLCPSGLLADYVTEETAPNLARLANTFLKVWHVRPAFPTLSLPNQMSVLTGLLPEEHGLVDDTVYDPVWQEEISAKSSEVSPKWFAVNPAPIGQVLERLGYRSEMEGFAIAQANGDSEAGGADVSPGVKLSKRRSGNEAQSVEGWVEVLKWLKPPKGTRPKFMAMFLDEPGRTAELYGPHAEETLAAVHEVDGMLGVLLQQLDEHDLRDDVNILITGLHGVADVHDELFLEDFVDSADYELHGGLTQPMAGIWPGEGKEWSTYRNLTEGHPGLPMNVYLKHDVPAHLNYRHHRRIAPVVALADEGWVISKSRRHWTQKRGSCGYDNTLPSMHSVLLASGPGLAKNKTVSSMNVTDVYHLICHLLGVEELMNNKTKAISSQFVSHPCPQSSKNGPQTCLSEATGDRSKVKQEGSIGAGEMFVVVCLLGLVVLAVVLLWKSRRRSSPAQNGYRRLEPDLSLRTEPLLNSSLHEAEDSIQLSVLSESKNGHGDDEGSDDDSPPGTFTI